MKQGGGDFRSISLPKRVSHLALAHKKVFSTQFFPSQNAAVGGQSITLKRGRKKYVRFKYWGFFFRCIIDREPFLFMGNRRFMSLNNLLPTKPKFKSFCVIAMCP